MAEARQADNPMLKPHIAKVVVNIGVGEGGDRLRKAERVLEMVTGRTPTRTISTKTNRDWGTRTGMPIGAKVTLRGEDADEFLKKAFWVRNNKIPDYSFDDGGNLNFGIPDFTDFPEQRYDPEIGIFGMDIAITIERPGYRVKRRRLVKRRVPARHRVSREEAMEFIKQKFDVEVIEW